LLCVSIHDPSQRIWPDGHDGFPAVIVVAGIIVVTDASGVPDVTVVTGTVEVCTGGGDTGDWDVSVHAVTRISAKSNPTARMCDIVFFMLHNFRIEESAPGYKSVLFTGICEDLISV